MMRKVIALIAMAAVGTITGIAHAAQVKPAYDESLCLSISGGTPISAGAQVNVETCDITQEKQDWDLKTYKSDPSKQDQPTLVQIKAGVQDDGRDLCLDNKDGKVADNNKIQPWGCNQSGPQIWVTHVNTKEVDKIVVATSVTFKYGPNTDYCLDVSGSGTSSGTVVQLFTCNGTDAQNWIVE